MFKSFISSCIATAVLAADGVFDYKRNGADWGKLAGNELCDSGRQQSPINLADWLTFESKDLAINLKPDTYIDYTTASMEKKKDTVIVTTPNGEMELVFDSGSTSQFKLAQFHVHAPSEHTYKGEHYDLEMHFVHTYLDGSLGAVIGVFFDREKGGDGDNLFIDQLKALWSGAGTVRNNQKVNVEGFLDSLNMKEFWSYDGSLTTPTCTEGIKWSVLAEVQPISEAQLINFTALWEGNNSYAEGNGNNREVQSHNGRRIYFSKWSDPANKIATIVLGVLFGVTLIALFSMCCILKMCPKKIGLEPKQATTA